MFISYAQNLEDALLWRALGSIPQGFFIDVGAGDPVAESVTKAFSLAGWTGINIEPSPVAFAMLAGDRPHDVNLQVAAGAEAGFTTYHAVDGGNGLSTSVAEYAARYTEMSWPVAAITVPVRTLADICDEHAPTTIHFLKIDVEGAERQVLEGADFRRHRPWVVMVESIEPMVLLTPTGEQRAVDTAPTTTHHEWEPLLLAADYRFVLFDGLNRVYVAAEHHDRLAPALQAPVGVLDDVVRADLLAERTSAANDRAMLEQSLAAANERADDATARCDDALRQLEAVARERDTLAAEVGVLRTEVDRCTQEIYEGSRALSSFAAQRQAAQQRVAELEMQLAHQGAELHVALGQAEHGRAVERELNAVLASKAWRLTRPLRAMRGVVSRARRRTP